MSGLSEMWPFVPGQQELIFTFVGAAIVGLIALNVLSALRQRLPFQKVLSGLFVQIGTESKTERYVRLILLVLSVAGFFALVIDIQVNGVQLIHPDALNKQ